MSVWPSPGIRIHKLAGAPTEMRCNFLSRPILHQSPPRRVSTKYDAHEQIIWNLFPFQGSSCHPSASESLVGAELYCCSEGWSHIENRTLVIEHCVTLCNSSKPQWKTECKHSSEVNSGTWTNVRIFYTKSLPFPTFIIEVHNPNPRVFTQHGSFPCPSIPKMERLKHV